MTKGDSFEILLRVDFFKREPYRLFITETDLLFEPVDQPNERFSVCINDVKKIFVYGSLHMELEIQMESGVIFGSFQSVEVANRAIAVLMSIFTSKLKIIL